MLRESDRPGEISLGRRRSEAKCVQDDADRGGLQPSERPVEHAGGDRNAGHVVDKGEHEVLADVTHHGA